MERFIGWGGWSEADGLKWELNTIQAAIPIHFRSRPYAQNHTLRAAMAQSQHDQQSTAFTSTAERRRTTSTAQQPSTTNQPSVPLTETREAFTARYVLRLDRIHASSLPGQRGDSRSGRAMVETVYDEVLTEWQTATGNTFDPSGRPIKVFTSPLKPDDWDDRYWS
jgi:hypothetical protein